MATKKKQRVTSAKTELLYLAFAIVSLGYLAVL